MNRQIVDPCTGIVGIYIGHMAWAILTWSFGGLSY